MKKTLSQNLWIKRKQKDNYFNLSKIEGYRSRAAYKLIEINAKYSIFNKSYNVVDLGSSPGSWCQVLVGNVKTEYKIIAVDINNMQHLDRVLFLKEDIKNIIENKSISLPINQIGLVLSDMAPKSTGHKFTDQARAETLSLLAFSFAKKYLIKKGNCIIKLLRGPGEKDLINSAKSYFNKVELFKPNSSRKESKEIYLICLSFNNLHT